MRKIFAALILTALLALAAGCAPAPAPEAKPPAAPAAPASETGVTPGRKAPGFTLKGPDGTAVAVPVAGKVTVLNFWATWCPPCREELPELDRFARDNPAVAFYAVDIDEPPARVQSFLKQNGYALPVLLDGGGKVAQTYRISAVPTTVVIDRTGVIKLRKSGPVTAAELTGVIRGL